MTQPSTDASLINWDLAFKTATNIVGAGPKLSSDEIEAEVAGIREAADAAVGHVQDITRISVGNVLDDSPTLVSDRPTWIKANIEGFRTLLTPVLQDLVNRPEKPLSNLDITVGSASTGVEMGMIMAFLADKVLGQFEPFCSLGEGPSGGRLVLVAPNIVKVRQELNVDPADFRMWVCLHEQTHRVQFNVAPWLKEYLAQKIRELTLSLFESASDMGTRFREAVSSTANELGQSNLGLEKSRMLPAQQLRKVLNEREAALFSELTAIMSLLEGHANVVMDAVDRSIVPSVKTIRNRFSKRSEGLGAIEKFIRKMIGMETKMRQYQDGQKFVQAVVDEVGMEQFNLVWERPENLPSEEEIHDPQTWVQRMGLNPVA